MGSEKEPQRQFLRSHLNKEGVGRDTGLTRESLVQTEKVGPFVVGYPQVKSRQLTYWFPEWEEIVCVKENSWRIEGPGYDPMSIYV